MESNHHRGSCATVTQCVTLVLNFSTNNLFREGNYNRASRFWKEPAVCSQAFWHLVQESPHWQPTKCVQYHHTQKGMIINLIYLEQWLYPGGKDIRGIYGSIISIIQGITTCTHKHTFARTTFRMHSLAMLAGAFISTFARVGSGATTCQRWWWG